MKTAIKWRLQKWCSGANQMTIWWNHQFSKSYGMWKTFGLDQVDRNGSQQKKPRLRPRWFTETKWKRIAKEAKVLLYWIITPIYNCWCFQMLPHAPRCPQMLPDAARCSQMPPDAVRCCQILSDAPTCSQLLPNAPKHLCMTLGTRATCICR